MKLRSEEEDLEDSATTGVVSCFFCLQDSRELSSDSPNQTEPFSLRHVLRFLKIFENNEEEDKLSEDLKRKLFSFANESNVFICQDCSKMMDEFKELYHLMEVTKLRMNWCIQKMNDVMVLAKSKEKARVSENAIEMDDGNLIEILRSKTIDQMKKITSHPQVILRKAKLPRATISHTKITEKAPTITTRFNWNCKASKKSSPLKLNKSDKNSAKQLITRTNISKLNEERRKRKLKNAKVKNRYPPTSFESHDVIPKKKRRSNECQPEINGTSSTCPNVRRSKRKSSKVLRSRKEDDTKITCSYCRAQFSRCKTKGNEEEVEYLERHLLQFHGHHYFPKHKLDSISDSQFQKILVDLLFKDLVDEKVEQGKTSASCSYCDETFAIYKEKVRRKACIFQIKFHLIKKHYEKLEEKLLEIQKDAKILEILEGCNPDGRMCETGCGVYLPDVFSQVMHDRMYCTRTPTSTGILNEEDQSPEKINGDRQSISSSLPTHHKTSAGSKTKKKKVEFNPDGKASCPYCNAQFMHTRKGNERDSLDVHILKYHCQHFFPRHKLDSISDSDFQKILVELLFKDIVDVGMTSCRCHYCDKSFKYSKKGNKRAYLFRNKLHLIKFHHKKLEEKLMLLQKDPNLAKTLAASNPRGRMCKTGCGVYLRDLYIQATHDKMHCTRKENPQKQCKTSKENPPEAPGIISKTSGIGKQQQRLPNSRRSRSNQKDDGKCNGGGPTILKCSQCRAKFKHLNSTGSRLNLRRHTVTYHCEQYLPIEKHKLDHVTVPDYKKILSDILFKDFISGGEEECCPFCEKKYTVFHQVKAESVSSLKLHLIEFHFSQVKEKLLQIQKDPSLPKILESFNIYGKFCRCGVYLSNHCNQCQHEQFHCVLTEEKVLVKGATYQSNFTAVPSRPDKTCCKLCNRKITNRRQSMFNHWGYSCPKGLRRRDKQNHVKMGVDGNKIPRNCFYCRFQFSVDIHSNSWNRHLVGFHPEHFFLDLWEEESTSDTVSLTKDQFQRIICNLLFPEFVPKNGPLKCQPSCQIRCKSTNDLKVHLVRHHKNEMKDRLKMILGDASLLKKLGSFEGQGKSCPCGMYIPSGDTAFNQNFHDKYHCKLNTRSDDNNHLPSTNLRSKKTSGPPITPIEEDINDEDEDEGQLKINSTYSLSNAKASKVKADASRKNKDPERRKSPRKRKKVKDEDEDHEKSQCNLKTEEEAMDEVVDKNEDVASSEVDIDLKYGVTFEEMDDLSPLPLGEVDIGEFEELDLEDEDEYKFSELIQAPFNQDEIVELMEESDSWEEV